MIRRKRRHVNKKENKTLKYMVVLLLIVSISVVIGYAYLRPEPKKDLPVEVSNIVNQLNVVDAD